MSRRQRHPRLTPPRPPQPQQPCRHATRSAAILLCLPDHPAQSVAVRLINGMGFFRKHSQPRCSRSVAHLAVELLGERPKPLSQTLARRQLPVFHFKRHCWRLAKRGTRAVCSCGAPRQMQTWKLNGPKPLRVLFSWGRTWAGSNRLAGSSTEGAAEDRGDPSRVTLTALVEWDVGYALRVTCESQCSRRSSRLLWPPTATLADTARLEAHIM